MSTAAMMRASERGLCFVPLLFLERETERKGMRGKATNIKSFPDALFHAVNYPVYKAQNHTTLFRFLLMFIKFAYCR